MHLPSVKTLYAKKSKTGVQFTPPRKPKGPVSTSPSRPPPVKQKPSPRTLDEKSKNSKTACLSSPPPFMPRAVWCSIQSRRNKREEEQKSERNELLLLAGVGTVVVLGAVLFVF